MTRPFNIAMPDSAIKPTAADIEKGISLSIKANIPPVNARGTPVKIIIESLNEPKANNNNPIINPRVTGTTILTQGGAALSPIAVFDICNKTA